jgi:hypothetical protein
VRSRPFAAVTSWDELHILLGMGLASRDDLLDLIDDGTAKCHLGYLKTVNVCSRYKKHFAPTVAKMTRLRQENDTDEPNE